MNPLPQGDYLARLLNQGDLGWQVVLAGMAVAFGLGAVHALSPGHGKTIVAAYLVDTRGTPRHAALLGAVVTVTHTASVFLLGFVTLFLSQYVLPDRLYPVLGVVSGAGIVWVGATLLWQRWRALQGWHSHGGHHHHHDHDHDHDHDHRHVPEEVTLGSLLALGASGGLVPCPSALVLLLTSVALGRTALGLGLLVAFSLGLAVVLTAIGIAVLYAKHLLPERAGEGRVWRVLPVVSAAFIVCVGVAMAVVALRGR